MVSPISSYSQAARLIKPQASLNTMVVGDESKSDLSFKGALSNAASNLYDNVKQQGRAADAQIVQQVMGVGNVEQTAISLAELNANMEVIAQALRIGIEKLNELTTRTMGG